MDLQPIHISAATTLALLTAAAVGRRSQRIAGWVTGLAAAHALAAVAALGHRVALAAADAPRFTALPGVGEGGLAPRLAQDGVACTMLALVALVGFAVCRYSLRYLDGDPARSRYFRAVALTLGSVSAAALLGHLGWFLVAWVGASAGLHRLLLHDDSRPAARRAAWTKFAVSRVGDLILVAALVLAWRAFGTLDMGRMFAAMDDGAPEGAGAVAALIALGALAKSAQLPFHVWLPETLDTPTPVSALMHAGVVNAGGFLVVRTSPLFAGAEGALTTLTLVGAGTAALGSLVMLTQPSVKKALAHSTVAQMGLMMLQCGLGAYTAAMLHIVAHSLYKAHAFLASGSAVEEARATALGAGPAHAGPNQSPRQSPRPGRALAAFALVAPAALLIIAQAVVARGEVPLERVALLATFGLAIGVAASDWARIGAEEIGLTRRVHAAMAAAPIAALGLYLASYAAIDAIVGGDVAPLGDGRPATAAVLIALAGLAGTALVQALARSNARGGGWLDALHVHASNGFYLDVLARRASIRR